MKISSAPLTRYGKLMLRYMAAIIGIIAPIGIITDLKAMATTINILIIARLLTLV